MGKGLGRCRACYFIPWDATGRQENNERFTAPTLRLSSRRLHILMFSQVNPSNRPQQTSAQGFLKCCSSRQPNHLGLKSQSAVFVPIARLYPSDPGPLRVGGERFLEFRKKHVQEIQTRVCLDGFIEVCHASYHVQLVEITGASVASERSRRNENSRRDL